MSKIILRNICMIYIVNLAKMILPLITLPYLARVLTTGCYGEVAYITALMRYVQLFIDFGFMLSATKDIALSIHNKKEVGFITGNIIVAKVILSIISFLVILYLSITDKIVNNNIAFTILSFMVCFLSIFLLDFVFRGFEKMKIIAVRFVLMKLIATVFTFAFIKNDADIIWIPILDIIGSLVAIILVWKEFNKFKINLTYGKFRIIYSKIKESFIYFASSMSVTIFTIFNTIVVGRFFSIEDVAYWSICLQLLCGVQALYTPVIDGIYPYMVKKKDVSILKRSIKIFMPLVSVGCIFTFFIADDVLNIIGGSKYIYAADILRCLIPVMFFGFLSMLFGWPTLGAINKQKETTKTTLFTAVMQMGGLILLIMSDSLTLVNIAVLRSITEFILFITRFGYFYKYRYEFQNSSSIL
jgi:polysaccharide transporter